MADDTRRTSSNDREDLSREALTANPDNKAFTGSQWSDGKPATYKPPASANMMEGGTQHTAGGKVPEVTLANAFTTGRPLTEVHKAPCVRDSFMVGLGAGFATGGGRMIFGSPIMKSCNWAVGSAALGSIVMYNYCQYRRQQEKAGMTRAVEILHRKEVEKQAREQRKQKLREERREAKDKEQDAQLAEMKLKAEANASKPWYKLW